MTRYWLVLIMLLGLCSCTEKNAHYYRSHLKQLEQAMKQCPGQDPEGVTCQQLEEIATEVNGLARKLQYNPQGFGKTILKLQEAIAKQQMDLSQDKKNQELHAKLEQNKKALAEHLAVVRLLESPES